MCGILLKISKNDLAVPSCIPLNPDPKDRIQSWDTQDSTVIQTFLTAGSKLKPLTSQQLKKLNNLHTLRDLNSQLVKIRNNIKISHEEKQSQIDQIQIAINEYVEDDDMNQVPDESFENLICKISNRGPNYLKFTQFKHDSWNFQLFTSILSLRKPFTAQPIFKDEFILQFNGELYNQQCLNSNDTQFIIEQLHENLNNDRNESIINTLKMLEGEFAIILIDLVDNKVYFGRDSIGKRSLTYSLTNDELMISSVPQLNFKDCKNEIYQYDLLTHDLRTHQLHYLPNPVFETEKTETELIQELSERLFHSTKIRIDSISPFTTTENESKLAVLFSGGLDCTIIANLICRSISEQTSIDLLTVGFENPRTQQSSSESPDRKLALKSWFHLCKLFPRLNIQLVEINVDYKRWLIHKSRVQSLMYPCETEMDLSIAIAFYFASSNIPEITTMSKLNNTKIEWDQFEKNPQQFTNKVTNYNSTSKVLFSGLGADELFGGYSRHEGIFNQINDTNYTRLSESLNYDISIIHERNLSRDDKVISCWGKELRYPYLDEFFINWVVEVIPPQLKFKYEIKLNKKGKSQMYPIRKWILRELAKLLQMDWVSVELKRAIQFGAKSAKLEIGQNKSKGTDKI